MSKDARALGPTAMPPTLETSLRVMSSSQPPARCPATSSRLHAQQIAQTDLRDVVADVFVVMQPEAPAATVLNAGAARSLCRVRLDIKVS